MKLDNDFNEKDKVLCAEINVRFPAMIEDDKAFEEVINLADTAFRPTVKKVLRGYYKIDHEILDDAMQNAFFRVSQLRKTLKEHAKDNNLYSYLKGVYRVVAMETVRTTYSNKWKYQESSMEEYEEKRAEGEHSIKDSALIDGKNEETKAYEPIYMWEKNIKEQAENKLGSTLLGLLADTKEVPHMVVAFCYSVYLPILVKTTVEMKTDMTAYLQSIFKYMEEEFFLKDRISDEKSLIYGKAFMEKFKILLKKVNEIPFPIEKFCMSVIIQPEIQKEIDLLPREEVKKKKYYREMLRELQMMCKDDSNLGEKGNTLVKSAKVLMEKDNVRRMSEKFSLLCNMNRLYGKSFEWGVDYLKRLDEEYWDSRHNFYIPNEGELIFAEVFSKPTNLKEGAKENPERDYLGRNIQNYSNRMRSRLLEKALEAMAEDEMVRASDIAIERLEKAYRKYKVS